MSLRPPVRGTARVLTGGSLVSAALFILGLSAAAARLPEAAQTLSNLGIAALLATPALGLVATALELRTLQPRSAMLAVVVLVVLGVATVIALATR